MGRIFLLPQLPIQARRLFDDLSAPMESSVGQAVPAIPCQRDDAPSDMILFIYNTLHPSCTGRQEKNDNNKDERKKKPGRTS
jgi:hypothetical protein